MTADFFWKRNDTGPPAQSTLSYTGGPPVDLTGATVKFIMAVGLSAAKVNAAAVIIDPPNGIVSYTPIAADTNLIGDYSVEWQVIFPGGSKQTFPNPGYQTLSVTADLDNA